MFLVEAKKVLYSYFSVEDRESVQGRLYTKKYLQGFDIFVFHFEQAIKHSNKQI